MYIYFHIIVAAINIILCNINWLYGKLYSTVATTDNLWFNRNYNNSNNNNDGDKHVDVIISHS